jgi:hypothetical protein
MRKNTLFLGLMVLLWMAPGGIALANMAPPPSVAWFTLEYETNPAPRLQGLQLVGCPSEACEQPVLLQQYGVCEADGCLSGPASSSGWSTAFDCAANRCRSTVYPNHGGTAFKLVAEFADQVRVSPVTGGLPSSFGQEAAWKVSVRAQSLAITPDDTIPAMRLPYERFSNNLGWVGLSLLVEMVVAGVGLKVIGRTDWRVWRFRLLAALLANLASLPVVWLTIPAFGQFQTVGSRLLGMISLVLVAFYVALLVIIYRAQRKAWRWAFPALGMVFLVVSAACMLMLALNYYGSYSVFVQGLSPTAVIVLSEALAVTAEAALIGILCRVSLRAPWVWSLSLAMNAASFLVGVALVGR